MPPTTYETEIEVRSYELDSFGHANHAVMLNYLEHARFTALAQGGFPYTELERRGWGVYVVRIEVDYLKEARLGDRLLIRTTAESPGRASMVLAQEVSRRDTGDVVARARVTAVWVNEERRPVRVPREVRAAFGW
ncbi:MAG: acyl-CoA thioesterase [Gemmatimonadota bacterium]